MCSLIDTCMTFRRVLILSRSSKEHGNLTGPRLIVNYIEGQDLDAPNVALAVKAFTHTIVLF